MANITYFQYFFMFFHLMLFLYILLNHFIFKRADTTTNARHGQHLLTPPELPVIGHFHHLKPAMYKCFHNLSTAYGPLLKIRLGLFSFVLISSFSLTKQVFKTNDLNFSARPKSALGSNSLFGELGFIFAPYGDYWRFIKKLTVTELLSPRQLERSKNVRHEELEQFLLKLTENARKNASVDLSKELTTLTNNTTCRMVMSTRCSGEDNEAEMCRVLLKESSELSAKIALAKLLGPLGRVGQLFIRKQALDVPRRYDQLLEKLMREHEEKAKSIGSGSDDDKDLMDILLRVHYDKDAEFKISRSHIKAFFSDIFFAGTDTSSTAMQWIMAELINHPNTFNKLREEIESCINGETRLVNELDIPNLHFMTAVVMETIRLHPPGAIIPRSCREDCQIDGYDIPQGTQVAINVYSINRDPNIWENPDEFYPERFLTSSDDNNKDLDDQKESMLRQHYGIITFGGGRRMCPGMNFALTLITATVAAMVQCFDWHSMDGKKVDMKVKSGLSMRRANPLVCRPVNHFSPLTS